MTAFQQDPILTPWSVRCASSLPIVIGLVNNMPDAAFETTEAQFRKLLFSAMPPGAAMQLRLFTIDDVPRSAESQVRIAQRYESTDALWSARLDGLIVSGLEPRMASLSAEPYWTTLTKVFDWAARHTHSAIFSCLAAHAAVLHFDGIERQPLPAKLSGVFDCEKSSDALAWAGMPEKWAFPHSRHNGLSSDALTACGYRICSSSPAVGVDIFEKQIGSHFTFMQGHPEYDAGALLREYRRDVRRFLTGKRENHPHIPVGYFDRVIEAELEDFRLRAERDRRADIFPDMPDLAENALEYRWRAPAMQFYRQWFGRLLDSHISHGSGEKVAEESMRLWPQSQVPARASL
jgi:homoserine O-succinyltransferase/O-acetyltransferase